MIGAHGRPRGPVRRFAAGLLVLAAALVGPATRDARAYVQYQVIDQSGLPTGVKIKWDRSCIDITAYPADLTEMTFDQVTQAATAAATTWSQVGLPCPSYLDIEVATSTLPKRAAGTDAYNVLIFRNPWCDPNKPDECQPEALAITSVFAGRMTGTIHDADIEVNTENFVWGDLAAQPGAGKQDLQNALTHEMGHLIGLDHNCFTPGVDPFRQTDETGAPAPFCASADPTVQEATMYTKAEFGDLTKRTLSPDDENAVCGVYPAAADPHYCPPPPADSGSGCDCSVGDARAPAGALFLAAGLVSAVATRRRRR